MPLLGGRAKPDPCFFFFPRGGSECEFCILSPHVPCCKTGGRRISIHPSSFLACMCSFRRLRLVALKPFCTPMQPSAICAGWGPLSQLRRVRPHTSQPSALDNSCHQPAALNEAVNVIGCLVLANRSTGGETEMERSVIGKQHAGEMLICHCSFYMCVCVRLCVFVDNSDPGIRRDKGNLAASVPTCLVQLVLKMIKTHRKGHRGRKEGRKPINVGMCTCTQPETNAAAAKHIQSSTWSELAALTRITATIFIPIWPCQS